MSRSPMADIETAEAPPRKETAAQRERRFVYSGQEGAGQNEYLTRGNRPLKRRKKSPFKIVSLIAGISILIVFYVWNKITVNRLEEEIKVLGDKQVLLEGNIKRHQAEIGRKSDLKRIEDIAEKKLRMIPNPEPQVYFEVENYRPAAGEPGRR